MDIDIYVRPRRERPFLRARKFRESLPAQKKLNSKNALKYLTRLAHTNFTQNDIALDLTYSDEHLPSSRKEIQRDVKNYIARLRARCKKYGLPELKYIYIISEWTPDGDAARPHIHMIVGKMDRSMLEDTWSKGRCNTQRLQFDELGITDKVRYIAGQAVGRHYRTWSCSQNLVRPQAIISDKAVSKSMAERMATAPEDRAYFEKLYPGWTFTDCQCQEDFISGTSIYIRMRRYSPGGFNAKTKNA